ncbi:MAG: flagellar export chaperone FliS [Desulfomonilia bacterium]|jgi:flagellar protein FliS|uniref:Flagellar protein FliS n=1 Tax=anaerobic digester metagenome TaxID=1263854 RepID=A0A485M6R1_9ZZZZ|nr:flagellar export chaperone FliS [Pseudomonadota bacterium]HON38605.1 flagellar export chaperone FliS [Deltaproteobacteria bacterium]HRS55348.1 flagellar export chaperone FliS [Desulfomonilia bacterium]HPD21739.1 flagellar export chaperone FliS [Deltaproteobacteria bacterium]HPX17436.1 flagellar export chaperone FliS [Deltaproteobacteria bacterium]
MSINSMGYEAYRKTQIQTADQGSLILMCYDGAINSLKKAREAQQEHDYQTRAHALGKAQNILWELTNSLNHSAGEIADNLESLYNYMIRRIVDAGYHNSIEPIDEVISYLQELKGSWEQIIKKSS